MNGHTTGFHPQTQKLEPFCEIPSFILVVKWAAIASLGADTNGGNCTHFRRHPTDERLRQRDICRGNNRLKYVPFKRNLDERNSKEEGACTLKDQLY